MRIAHVLGVGLLLVAVSSCKKESEQPQEEPSKEQLLSARSWRVSSEVAVTTRPGQAPVSSDLFASRPNCEKDDFVRFQPDNVVVMDAGPTRCHWTHPQTVNGTWNFNAAKTELILTENGGAPYTLQLEELTGTTLAVSSTYDGGSWQEKITTTYTAL